MGSYNSRLSDSKIFSENDTKFDFPESVIRVKFSKLAKVLATAGIFFSAFFSAGCGEESEVHEKNFLNVSYDPTRKLYAVYNEKFTEHWKKISGKEKLNLKQSHGGSASQARAVIEEKLEADVVTLASAYDIISIKKAGFIRGGWQTEFPDNSSPYTSTIVFLVRNGNPKNISDWDDLTREDVEIVMPNPKTSGGAQWGYLAAWEYAKRNFGGDESIIKNFMREIFLNVVALDTGAHSSTLNFVENDKGDVLVSWENEALVSVQEYPDKFEVVIPSLSILAEPTIAIVDKIAESNGNKDLATEYLDYLYSEEGQEIAAQNFYRPRNKKILNKYAEVFKPLTVFTIDEAFGGWVAAHKKHFADGGTFDQVTLGIKF